MEGVGVAPVANLAPAATAAPAVVAAVAKVACMCMPVVNIPIYSPFFLFYYL